ncbi:TPA: cysteine--tRNA ligase [Candidatus Berkelbacteria bacterium]|uniref:Cysteine--tRNA ligase n=1 Tax=Berkelbacteria bacterium GW2011_GWE1_39_12 TaxID=1618337 RepID=A0A0G4B1N7_9BACT|nr:MAG: cysteinyl-tRNA synthetase, cysteinyl-tRNA synthetase [Berkelbacteria bacterium GW2011_GWE1_39_12]HBO60443.1 cysteine--tRNA ligase [Candidatus Berkelbacteria bacterium]
MVKFYNSLGKEKQEFKPIADNQVKMYVCGPTVYDYAHLGNLRTYIFEDILRRVLELSGYKITEVMNITDVGHLTSDEDTGEDKIEKGAARENQSVWEIAEKYTKAFKEDLKELNIETPEIFSKATDHIEDQIEFIKKIEENGFVYKTSDGIYFDTSKLKDYGKLANLNVEGQLTGTRIEENKEKKNPADFALWKFSPTDHQRQMEWESPWGKGFPGWHIECSAMSTKYLGEQFDIHTGGVDHLTVHHPNEIAQSEAANGKIPANYWLHGEFLLEEGGKMAKSKGSFLRLSTLVEKGFEPLAYRYLALTAHYRSKLNFTWAGIEGAQNTLKSIRKLKDIETKLTTEQKTEYIQKIKDALNDDLDTPKALAILHQAQDFFLWQEFEPVFALDLEKQAKIPVEIEQKAKERDEARKAGDYAKADELRKEIEAAGFNLEDNSSGFVISKK